MGLLDVVVHRLKEEKLLCEKLILKTIAWAEDLWLNIRSYVCMPKATNHLVPPLRILSLSGTSPHFCLRAVGKSKLANTQATYTERQKGKNPIPNAMVTI